MRRILLVEDDFAVAEVARLLLEHEGYAVTVVGNGEDALREAQAHPPDLVITDVMMPLLDGDVLVQRMRQVPALARVPAIVVRADGERPGPGADDPLTLPLRKPLTVDSLLDGVARALG